MKEIHHGLSSYEKLLKECLDGHAANSSTPLPQVFGYLLGANPRQGGVSRETLIKALDELVDSMKTSAIKDGPADAGMTFFGQFVDHDITLDATSEIGRKIDPRSIRNVRTPTLDLDCVYGDGPEATPHLYSPDQFGYLLFGREGSPYDLARNCKGRALVGDPRNDENIIISQIQGAFISLHNILMGQMAKKSVAKEVKHCAEMNVRSKVWEEVVPSGKETFEQVRRFVRLHYQWLILNELLPAFVDKKVINSTLKRRPVW